MASHDEEHHSSANGAGLALSNVIDIAADDTVSKIGMTFGCLPPKLLVVKRVLKGSLAASYGVQEGDVCFAINNKKVQDLVADTFHQEMAKRPLHLLVRRKDSSPGDQGAVRSAGAGEANAKSKLQAPHQDQEVAAEIQARVLRQLQDVGDVKDLADAIQKGHEAGVSPEVLANARTRLAQLEKEKKLKQSAVDAIEALLGLQKVLEGTDVQALSDSINQSSKQTREALEQAKEHLARLRERVTEERRKNLLEEYSIEDKLGEGSFGVVYACRSRSTNQEYAVKMVDKVESPLQLIMEEVQMLEQLSHPNIVRFVDVVYEKCFVCIVMDKYAGGNLVACMLRHWKTKGKLTIGNSIPVCQQMANSIAYLHSKSIVHRDVKGDNYLTNIEELVDPRITVVLSDFGTAYELTPGERLHDACGTKAYWAPEFYDRDYALKVDVWAVGVIVYAMLDGRFPFQDEAEVRNSFLKVPGGLPTSCEHFIRKSLLRDEEKRLSGEQMAKHEFLKTADNKEAMSAVNSESGLQEGQGLFEELGVCEGVAERRDELVGRLCNWYDWFVNDENEGDAKPESSERPGNARRKKRNSDVGAHRPRCDTAIAQAETGAHFFDDKFQVTRQGGRMQTYEWWDPERTEKEDNLSMTGAQPLMSETADPEIVRNMLIDHNIDVTAFGRNEAKPLEQLASEVHSGVARLMLDATQHKKLVRVVDVVLLRVMMAPTGREPELFLVEVAERYPDGRRRQAFRLPGTKKEPHESTREATYRILRTLLKMEDCEVDFNWTKEVFEESQESPSFPGVTTVYRKEIVEGQVMTQNPDILKRVCLVGGQERFDVQDSKGNTKYYSWLDEETCNKKRVQLCAPEESSEISGLVQAPIGMKVEELCKFLLSGNVDVSKFGKNHTKTLKEFSQELVKGESSLMQDQQGRMLRVVDIVVLRIENGATGQILVQTEEAHSDGVKETRNRLPGHKRRPDENQFVAVRRVLLQELGIHENWIHIDAQGIKVLEEEKDSPSYPDLRTLYRKRIIAVKIVRV